MARMLIKADVVVGEDFTQAVVDQTICLEKPAVKIVNIQVRITELACEVQKDGAIIRGAAHKQIFYVGADNKVRHQSEDVLFSASAEVRGALPGMRCQVHPTVQDVEWRLVGTIPSTRLRQRLVVGFFVKITKVQQLNVVLGTSGPLYKVQRVVAEETSGTVVESAVLLPCLPDKIRAVHVVVKEFTATAADGQVVIDGVLAKQIFYICATDQVEYHEGEEVPFTVTVPVDGVQAGQDVDVTLNVVTVNWRLCGRTINQRVVLSVFCKVTETAQTMLATHPRGPLIKVGRVVGENTKEVLVEDQVCLDHPARKVEDIVAAITDLRFEVIRGKVIVEGMIHKQVFFVGSDDAIRHQAFQIPFSAIVEVPKAMPGMTAQVHPKIEHVTWTLLHETRDCPLDHDVYEDMFRVIAQRIVIQLFVKITEIVQVNVVVDP